MSEFDGIRYRTINVVKKDSKNLSDKRERLTSIVVATRILNHDNNKFIRITCSFCSPNDKFSKPYGQFVAYKRMTEASLSRNSVREVQISDGDRIWEVVKENVIGIANDLKIKWMAGVSVEQFK